jgi:hypothetical protein
LSGQLSCSLDRFAIDFFSSQSLFRLYSLERRQTDVGEPDSNPLANIVFAHRQLRRDACCGKVTHFSLQLEISAAASGRRDGNTDLGKNFIRAQGGSEQVGKKARDRYLSLPLGPDNHDLGFQRQHGRGMVIGRIAMG